MSGVRPGQASLPSVFKHNAYEHPKEQDLGPAHGGAYILS